MTEPVVFDRSPWGLVVVSGPDATSFLQAIVSQDLDPVDDGETVASLLLPARLRRPVAIIYWFARSADDIADEGDAPAAERIAKLAHYDAQLSRIARAEPVQEPLFEALAGIITGHQLPVGPFHDLRGVDPAEPCLDPDPALGYPAGQALARRLRSEAASNGIVYRSVRRPGGTCLAAFRPDLVQNLREGGIWRLTWRGTPEPTMTREAG